MQCNRIKEELSMKTKNKFTKKLQKKKRMRKHSCDNQRDSFKQNEVNC